jgi:hypothetical protein
MNVRWNSLKGGGVTWQPVNHTSEVVSRLAAGGHARLAVVLRKYLSAMTLALRDHADVEPSIE